MHYRGGDPAVQGEGGIPQCRGGWDPPMHYTPPIVIPRNQVSEGEGTTMGKVSLVK